MRTLRSAAAILLALSASTYVFVSVRDGRVEELTQEVDRLEQARQELEDYARRVTASRRVAQVDVLDQTFSPQGTTETLLRFQEIGDGGTIGEPIYRDVIGDLVYFEAAVLKFDHDLVGRDKREEATSLAVFRRIFGDHQVAAGVPYLHGPASSGGRTGAFDSEHAGYASRGGDGLPTSDAALWEMFWGFMSDPGLAATYGVRVAQVEAPAIAPKTGQTWELSIDASGGVNILLVGNGKVKPESGAEDLAVAGP